MTFQPLIQQDCFMCVCEFCLLNCPEEKKKKKKKITLALKLKVGRDVSVSELLGKPLIM